MARKSFSADERSLLEEGAVIEWKNGTSWGHRVRLISGIEVTDGWSSVRGIVLTRRGKTVMVGDEVRVFPGALRAV